MALKKQIEFNTGLVAEYWRIRELKMVNGNQISQAIVELWKDKATRDTQGKSFVMEYSFEIESSFAWNVIEDAYEKLKLLEQFNGAIDA